MRAEHPDLLKITDISRAEMKPLEKMLKFLTACTPALVWMFGGRLAW